MRQNRRDDHEAIEDLDVLPVFFRLKNKPVLIVGGTRAAAWKADLMAAAGAKVYLCAPELSQSAKTLLKSKRGRQIEWLKRSWCDTDISVSVCIVADPTTIGDRDRFMEVVKASGTPLNLIDDPMESDFQFGSIVNRSPIVIGISTSGGAPILAQKIRQKIEAILPWDLSAWGRLAKESRSAVAERLSSIAERRTFWKLFASRAFSTRPSAHEIDHLLGLLLKHSVDEMRGVQVIEISTDKLEDLTIGQYRQIADADVIVHDHQVPCSILRLSSREAQKICVSSHKDFDLNTCSEAHQVVILRTAPSNDFVMSKLKQMEIQQPSIYASASESEALAIAARRQVGQKQSACVSTGMTAGNS